MPALPGFAVVGQAPARRSTLPRLISTGRRADIAVTGKPRPACGNIPVACARAFRRNPKSVELAVLEVKTKSDRLVRQRGQIFNPTPPDSLQGLVRPHRKATLRSERRHNL